ncbi:MAG: beta-N-acetylhexosaminidase [Arhodomonas sp.]|nr:beta-N-acetylhexosaminidase [Arhodomonas sp.]
MSLGPLMIGVSGPALTGEERRRLLHPGVGGVILFRRNFRDVSQLIELVAEIRSLRTPPLIVASDHEGGGCSASLRALRPCPPPLGSAACAGAIPPPARDAAERLGWLLAAELRGIGVDLSLGPVVDVNYGVSGVIGDRALADTPEGVTELAASLVRGMHRAGMAAVAKHFPGHGGVQADSHAASPSDPRDYQDLLATDLQPFRRLILNGIEAVMTAHVI